MGDLNFLNAGEYPTSVSNPGLGDATNSGLTAAQFASTWNSELRCWAEVSSGQPTHYISASNRLGRLDRAYTLALLGSFLSFSFLPQIPSIPLPSLLLAFLTTLP